jgi:aldehyde:ferredoxin oxidoreductase
MIDGYLGRILRIDLTEGKVVSESIDETILRKYVGGASLGIKFLYDEVPPGVEWHDSENRLFIGSGPLGGTRIEGSGATAVVTKGALTNGIASSQANGFFGTYLRSSGFDGIILQGASPKEVYLHIHDGTADLRDASSLVGKDTYAVEDMIRKELGRGKREASILSIGPAGENLVKFALIFTDMGHVAAHNGVGAVMGSKKLKAIAVDRGKAVVPIKDKEALSRVAKEIRAGIEAHKFYSRVSREGTVGSVFDETEGKSGLLPVKNYTTNIHVIDPVRLRSYSSQQIRARLRAKPAPCWACASRHCHMGEISEGKYAGRIVEEPEFESMAAWSSLVGISDVTATVALANEVDRLGMDTNEAAWVIAWLMECYEKGVISKQDLDGVEMKWGNDDAVMTMLQKIASRKGIGSILAEGVMRASQHIGGEAAKLAIYTQKGNTPRSHDHRVVWLELFDTCVSNTGTLEAHTGAPMALLGLSPVYDRYDPEVVSTIAAKIRGAMLFEDSLVTCRFRTGTQLDLMCQAVNAATGWSMDVQDAMVVGRRAVNVARVFNLRHGIGAELDCPSLRYGSTPSDGNAAGQGIMPHWDKMLRNYYNLMGWNEEGIPLPETLNDLELGSIIRDIWR